MFQNASPNPTRTGSDSSKFAPKPTSISSGSTKFVPKHTFRWRETQGNLPHNTLRQGARAPHGMLWLGRPQARPTKQSAYRKRTKAEPTHTQTGARAGPLSSWSRPCRSESRSAQERTTTPYKHHVKPEGPTHFSTPFVFDFGSRYAVQLDQRYAMQCLPLVFQQCTFAIACVTSAKWAIAHSISSIRWHRCCYTTLQASGRIANCEPPFRITWTNLVAAHLVASRDLCAAGFQSKIRCRNQDA